MKTPHHLPQLQFQVQGSAILVFRRAGLKPNNPLIQVDRTPLDGTNLA
jgi:hypothetical protein